MDSVCGYAGSPIKVTSITSSVLEQKLPLFHSQSVKCYLCLLFFLIFFIIQSLQRLFSFASYLFSWCHYYSERILVGRKQKMFWVSVYCKYSFQSIVPYSDKKWYKKISPNPYAKPFYMIVCNIINFPYSSYFHAFHHTKIFLLSKLYFCYFESLNITGH